MFKAISFYGHFHDSREPINNLQHGLASSDELPIKLESEWCYITRTIHGARYKSKEAVLPCPKTLFHLAECSRRFVDLSNITY